MATCTKQLVASLILFFLLAQVIAEASSTGEVQEGDVKASVLDQSQPAHINCGLACSRRCSKASRKKICFRTCTGCCKVCNCVPPGTYGNKEVCPCYATLKTTSGKLKCP
nr:gibberellin-regulated protein [Piper nigrum]